ncbi:GTPase Era [Helicobacter pametensis]|uniref:GTPase Era n=1 Tax=Helicobacter pametensis TaxID=95149 RepID=UPI000480C24A|nr:GTPase Era [Helicobacter pametensis]
MSTRAGFVSVLGRPNAGKSTFLNFICGQNLALVSHKANATRKRMNFIIMHTRQNMERTQIIFVDTPGIHKQEKLLNQFMLQEAIKAMGDCDLNLFLAPAYDPTSYYQEFLLLNEDRPHLLLLTQCDKVSKTEVLQKIAEYDEFREKFLALIPIECKDSFDFSPLLETISAHLPQSPLLYDEEILTTSNMREIYKEIIRESLFENLSDEIPYESDVVIEKFIEKPTINKVFGRIIVEKDSQKAIIIGKQATTIKRIGRSAREKLEALEGKKIFLQLNVVTQKNWSKTKDGLKKIGYDFDF